MKKFILTGLFVLTILSVYAQDKIFKRGGDILEVEITEVGTNELKYKLYNDRTGPLFTIDKERIIKVVYQNGRVETYQNSLNDAELYAAQSKNAVKINFLSPIFGYTQLNFEHNLRPGRSYELGLGIIGAGKRQKIGKSSTGANDYRSAAGAFISGGYKFIKVPNFVKQNDRFSHIMQGTYVKPEVTLGYYGENLYKYQYSQVNTEITKIRQNVFFGSLIIDFGRQLVLGDLLIIDYYAGIGYAFNKKSDRTYENGEIYSDKYSGSNFALYSDKDSGLGFNGGLKVGLLLNKK
ncbi:MAG: hypothetical protein WBP45_01685 [Daejeonella sp.]